MVAVGDVLAVLGVRLDAKETQPPSRYGQGPLIEKMEELDRQDRLYFPEDPEGRIRLKRYLDEVRAARQPVLRWQPKKG
jgi:hypothetical protein